MIGSFGTGLPFYSLTNRTRISESAAILAAAARLDVDGTNPFAPTITYENGQAVSVEVNGLPQEVRRSGGLVTSVGGKQVDSTFTRTSPAWNPYTGAESASGVPRFVEVDGVTGVMVEEGGAPLNLYSDEFDSSYWSKGNCSITADAATAPDGTLTMDKIVEDATASTTHQVFRGLVNSAGNIAVTVEVKAGERTWFRIGIGGGVGNAYFDVANGVLGTVDAGLTATIEELPEGCYRCTVAVTTAGSNVTIYIGPSNGDAGALYTGDGSSGLYVRRFNAFAKSYPTSPIKTEGSTVTRAAETLAIPTADVFKKGDWEILLEVVPTSKQVASGKYGELWRCEIDANNYYALRSHATTGIPYIEVRSGGVTVNTYNAADTALMVGTKYNIAIRGNGTTMALFLGGAKSAAGDVAYTEPVGTLPTHMYLGSNATGATQANAFYPSLHAFGEALDDATSVTYTTTPPTAPTPKTSLYLPLDSDLRNVARVVDLGYTAGELTSLDLTTATLG